MKFLTFVCQVMTIAILSTMVFADSEKGFNNDTPTQTYGGKITKDTPIDLAKAIALADSGSQQTILVEATVGSVCQKKGCWLSLEDTHSPVRVTFKDYGFFVPPTIKGRNVLVEGTIHKKTLSLAESKHYTQDAGGDPSLVTEPLVEYQMIAIAVETR
ncbi:DUF4920 domain-containing protein [Aurantivibrio plasticivorans]